MYKNDAEQNAPDPHNCGCAIVLSVQCFLVTKKTKKTAVPTVEVLRAVRMLRSYVSIVFGCSCKAWYAHSCRLNTAIVFSRQRV